MAKQLKTMFYCKNCGAESPKWVGRCPACGEWNTYIEEPVAPKVSRSTSLLGHAGGERKVIAPIKIGDIKTEELPRIKLPSVELDGVWGGG